MNKILFVLAALGVFETASIWGGWCPRLNELILSALLAGFLILAGVVFPWLRAKFKH